MKHARAAFTAIVLNIDRSNDVRSTYFSIVERRARDSSARIITRIDFRRSHAINPTFSRYLPLPPFDKDVDACREKEEQKNMKFLFWEIRGLGASGQTDGVCVCVARRDSRVAIIDRRSETERAGCHPAGIRILTRVCVPIELYNRAIDTIFFARDFFLISP